MSITWTDEIQTCPSISAGWCGVRVGVVFGIIANASPEHPTEENINSLGNRTLRCTRVFVVQPSATAWYTTEMPHCGWERPCPPFNHTHPNTRAKANSLWADTALNLNRNLSQLSNSRLGLYSRRSVIHTTDSSFGHFGLLLTRNLNSASFCSGLLHHWCQLRYLQDRRQINVIREWVGSFFAGLTNWLPRNVTGSDYRFKIVTYKLPLGL